MKISAKSDKGMVRANNQDSYAAGELPGNVAWAVVCDGMGGTAGGNVASATAVKVISEKIATCYHQGMSDNSIKNLLISAVESANALVFDASKKNEALAGMGTTVVAVIVNVDIVYVASVGDSRAYIMSDSLFQVTTDHSVVQNMIDNGEITKEEARYHPKKNIITRALGVDKEIRADFFREEMDKDNDIVLICTDGLTNYVNETEICTVSHNSDRYEIADNLVKAANENGGGDNITVVTLSN
ncbi:MAG: Stp1/IreP family PP2C-type Ser/Thr phosphatase [Clostridia bacterium]|nr:Stp1/IreP family PP2C-type Ser/Thr phosphatase [Clostridia bacterium]